jgi:DNA-binding MarR family transcriptional regulator/GNAT superfamily N-acetyltransferase
VEAELISGVRRFNRLVTQRVGALSDEYLARARPLGASRLLWELDDKGTDARAIRARLDLDSGYLSRLLRRLEAEGLIVVQPDPADHRVRLVKLTDAGRAERSELDRRSDDVAVSMLAPLREPEQIRLVEAMATVERLLTAGLVEFDVEDPASVDARFCLESYFTELDQRFDGGFDADVTASVAAEDLMEPAGLLLIARLAGDPIGCGAVKFHRDGIAEFKRIWVSPRSRGLGVGRRLLSELEAHAARRGATRVRLDTNRRLTSAIALYRASGYVEIPAFNQEPYAHHWFEKHLTTG